MTHKTLLAAALIGCAALPANAATLTFSGVTNIDALDFQGATLELIAFNPDLGTLDRVDFALTAAVTISAGIENDGPVAERYTLDLGSLVIATSDFAPQIDLDARPAQSLFYDLAAYDGTTDFAGPSGVSVSGQRIVGLGRSSWTDALILDAITGTDPLTFTAEGLSQVSVLGAVRGAPQPVSSFVGSTAVRLAVTYSYTETPPVATVPLPAGFGLLALGLGVLAVRRRA